MRVATTLRRAIGHEGLHWREFYIFISFLEIVSKLEMIVIYAKGRLFDIGRALHEAVVVMASWVVVLG
jgi:hypothetical protein